MTARDRAHLSGLMTIGKNVNDSLDRASLTNEGAYTAALNQIDLTFKNYQGSDCTSSYCRITVSGKDYAIYPYLNYTDVIGRNLTYFNSYENTAFGSFAVYTETHNSDFTHRLNCYQAGGSYVTPNEDRCVKLGKSLGAPNAECDTTAGSVFCTFN